MCGVRLECTFLVVFPTQSYHLGGMGCSNGVIAVNLVADLLRSPRHRNSNAVLLTIESTTPAYYIGHDRTRLVANVSLGNTIIIVCIGWENRECQRRNAHTCNSELVCSKV